MITKNSNSKGKIVDDSMLKLKLESFNSLDNSEEADVVVVDDDL